MLVVDTVGQALGNIVNSNAQVKSLLGFEKEDIMDKNITRLMPKMFAEIHNSFIVRFLQKTKGTPAKVQKSWKNMRTIFD